MRSVPTALFASSNHPLATDCTADDLVEHIQIVLGHGSGKTRGVLSPRVWHAADLLTKRAMVRRGFGFGTLPVHLARESVEAGDLVRLDVQGLPSEVALEMSAFVHRQRPLGTVGRWFLGRLGVELYM